MKTAVFVLLLLVFIASGCGILNIDDDRGRGIRPLESTLLIYADRSSWYAVDESRRPITLHLRSEKIYPCCNYIVLSSFNHGDSHIDVDVKGITSPPVCCTAFGPATADYRFDSDKGVYTLSVSYRKPGSRIPLKDEYLLTVDGESVELKPVETSFSAPASDFVIQE